MSSSLHCVSVIDFLLQEPGPTARVFLLPTLRLPSVTSLLPSPRALFSEGSLPCSAPCFSLLSCLGQTEKEEEKRSWVGRCAWVQGPSLLLVFGDPQGIQVHVPLPTAHQPLPLKLPPPTTKNSTSRSLPSLDVKGERGFRQAVM